MIPMFPTSPSILIQGYTVTPVPNIRRTEFENGMTRQTNNATRQSVERSVTVACCDVECYKVLKDFLRSVGANWFLWHCPDRYAQGLTEPIRVRIKGAAVTHSPQDRSMTIWESKFTLEGWDNA
jgi:hypothetical protein